MMDPELARPTPGFRPLYAQVRELMVERIATGQWKPGSLLPSEQRLAEEFGVSQGTVRKALSEMETQRLLVRRQGRGTFVAAHSRQTALFHFFRMVDHDGRRQEPVSRVLEHRVRRATREQAAALGIDSYAHVHAILRTRLIGGRPVILERVAVPTALITSLPLEVGQPMADELYVIYQRDHGVTIAKAEETLRAVAAQAPEVEHLGVALHTPLLEITRVARDMQGAPVELRVSRCDTAHTAYRNEIV